MAIVFAGSGLLVHLAGIAGIVMVPIALAVPGYGWSGLKDFLGRMARWKVRPVWYVLAVLLPLGVEVAALAIYGLYHGLSLPLSLNFWDLANVAGMFIKILYVMAITTAFSGFLLTRASEKHAVVIKGLIFTGSLYLSMALFIVAALVSDGNNVWLFAGLIPAGFIALWIYEKAEKSLLIPGLFLTCFMAFQLLSPVNWYLTGGFPGPRIVGVALYLASAAIMAAGAMSDKYKDRMPALLAALVVLATLASAVCIATVNTGISYPEPSGPYKVGKVAYDWVDENRTEIATGNSTYRELMVYVWYPADVPGNLTEAPAMDATTARGVRAGNVFSTAFLEGLSDHAYPAPPVAAGRSRYPVLLMSHGDGSSPLLMAVTATDLASHGYVVAGISHTYNSRGTMFPDGRILESDFNYTLIQNDPYDFNLSYYENAKLWARHNAEVELREADDVSFVLDRMEALNQSDDLFRGRIDTARAGTLGFSLGGAAAISSAERDDRIKAASDLDGALYHNVSIDKPTLLFLRGSRLSYDRPYDAVNQGLLTREQFEELKTIWDGYQMQVYTAPSTAYYVGIKGTEHGNFNDLGALGLPIDAGPVDGRHASRIINAYLVAFFDRHLTGLDSPLLNGTQAYPEDVFRSRVNGTEVAG
ncbi:predicted acetylhydrolase [Methanocella arvoryzae MRE50]|uniref:Predicted acetylhydrolase n=2 Tax=Methanocella TaxID=570266 RepID=Q0W7A5_METAR|nr:hypothetical protein orf21 [uncultured archaeon]CAJ35738.1 predicted acetylhydrolase [Methanocella arvoryzae MRE50]